MNGDTFEDALLHLRQGDFSLLAPCFQADAELGGRSRISAWHAEGRFEHHRVEVLEALTCACFLGENDTAEYLLGCGLPASGGGSTGMSALHWAASRGQVETVRLLLTHGAPLETRNMYGGTVLGQTVWSALNQPVPGQREAIVELMRAGADVSQISVPTGSAEIDALLIGTKR